MFNTELLESRRLLSVSVTFDSLTHQLTVTGVDKVNQIRVTMIEGLYASPIKLATIARPTYRPGPLLPGVSVYSGTSLVFNSAKFGMKVLGVDVYGSAGTDRVQLVSMNSLVSARVFGGDGDDAIDATAMNSPAAFVSGGDGNDFISLALDESKVGYTALGGAGDDVIHGSDRADNLYGDDGNDQIFAGAGDDYINGGLGDDLLCGEDGDDVLDHGGGIDVIDGGNGYDIGFGGKEDSYLDLEEIIITDR